MSKNKTPVTFPVNPQTGPTTVTVEGTVVADFLVVHPTLWGPPGQLVTGKTGWFNWSVTHILSGVQLGSFRYQRTALAYAREVAEQYPFLRDTAPNGESAALVTGLQALVKHLRRSEHES